MTQKTCIPLEKLRDHSISDAIPLLITYQMLPQLIRESIIDEAISSVTCTSEEVSLAYQTFQKQYELETDSSLQDWRVKHRLTSIQMTEMVTRQLRVEKFKHRMWEGKLKSYFLQRKGTLDRVIYSLLRVKDLDLVQELYFRLQAGEQTFAELAQTYAVGLEAQTNGICGPVELGILPPALAHTLSTSQPQQICLPIRLGEWAAITRLEKLLPAQLDEPMHHKLLHELFENWIGERVSQFDEMAIS